METAPQNFNESYFHFIIGGSVTPVYSIFERIGLGGGGKVKAVYQRMNALAEMQEFDPILLNLDHNLNQKLVFAELQANGTISPRVRNLTLPEACHTVAASAGALPFNAFPQFDEKQVKGKKTVYFEGGIPVMEDRLKNTEMGAIIKRNIPLGDRELRYSLLNGAVHQLVERKDDGIVETTDYASSLPIRWTKKQNGKFVIGKNLVTNTICRMERIYGQNLFEMIDWGNSVFFFDGVTSAYLSKVTKAKRALFLHADHRGPNGNIVPRSKFLIENFKGEAIITSTNVHKSYIKQDLTPAANVHVIPHYYEHGPSLNQVRKNLVTVSRLDLVGKPINECIDAFCAIMTEFPDVNYLIYGTGAGQKRLEAQIARLDCQNRVHLVGYTSDPLAVFQGAIASVYPTTTEGFGLSILEALSNGCPVISYDVNYGPREMIKTGKNGVLVPRGDIPAISNAMREVLLAPHHFQSQTNAGLERYTRTAYLDNYRNFVKALTTSP